MTSYSEPVRRARDIQTSRWRVCSSKLKAHSSELIRPLLIDDFKLPPEAVDKLAAAASLVDEAIALVESQTRST